MSEAWFNKDSEDQRDSGIDVGAPCSAIFTLSEITVPANWTNCTTLPASPTAIRASIAGSKNCRNHRSDFEP